MFDKSLHKVNIFDDAIEIIETRLKIYDQNRSRRYGSNVSGAAPAHAVVNVWRMRNALKILRPTSSFFHRQCGGTRFGIQGEDYQSNVTQRQERR